MNIALGKQSYELEANDAKCLLAIKKSALLFRALLRFHK